MDSGFSSPENIEDLVNKTVVFLRLGGVGMAAFCSLVRFNDLEDELQKIDSILKKMKRIHEFCTAKESIAALEPLCPKLVILESDIALLIP